MQALPPNQITMFEITEEAKNSFYFDHDVQNYVKLNLLERIVRAVLSIFGIMNSSEIRCRDLSGRAVFREAVSCSREADYKSLVDQDLLTSLKTLSNIESVNENHINPFLKSFIGLYQKEKLLKVSAKIFNDIELELISPTRSWNNNYELGTLWRDTKDNEDFQEIVDSNLDCSPEMITQKYFQKIGSPSSKKTFQIDIHGTSHTITLPLSSVPFDLLLIRHLKKHNLLDKNSHSYYFAFEFESKEIDLKPFTDWKKEVFDKVNVPKIKVLFAYSHRPRWENDSSANNPNPEKMPSVFEKWKTLGNSTSPKEKEA